MAARTRKIRHDDETRAKIQAGVIIQKMQKCVEGKVEMSASQVSCAKALLNKVLPDLQSVEMEGNIEHEVSDKIAELMSAVNGRTRTK